MGSKTLFGSIKLKGSLSDGTGDPLLTKDPTTNEVGTAANAIGSLADGKIFVGDASNEPQAVAVSGDITLSNAGVAAISAGVIVNADINAAAGIQFSKMEDLTASRALVSDANGDVSVSSVTATELGYLSGVTSAVQTQLSGKQATITGAASTITGSNLTANRALVANASGKVAVSSITSTELGHLSGASSNIQTQLNGKLTATVSSVAQGDILYYNGTGWVNLPRGTAGQALLSTSTTVEWGSVTANGLPAGGTVGQVLAKQSSTDFDADWESLTVSSITDLTATAAELNILDGATIDVTELNFLENASANIQDQLNNKMSSTLATDHIFKGVGGVATASTDLPTGITIGGAAIYRASGADVSLADGGTGASLADPGADRIMFWDDSAGQVTWLEAGSGITITGTTISASGGISGSTGSVDNAVLRADGTGGSTLQSSSVVINDSGSIGLGTSATSGTIRQISADGSASDVELNLSTKGNGSFSVSIGSTFARQFGIDNNGRAHFSNNGSFSSPTSLLHPRFINSSTSTSSRILTVSRGSTGTPENGIGAAVAFEVQTGVGNYEIGAIISGVVTDVTSSSENFDLVFSSMVSGSTSLTEHLRMGGSKIGFLGATPVARQVVPTGSTTDDVITALQNLGLFSQT